jgi:hypothetical protein
MSCKFICDGCGKEVEGYYNGIQWFKPNSWFAKNVEIEVKEKKTICIHACSRGCIEKASKKYETNDLVLPI